MQTRRLFIGLELSPALQKRLFQSTDKFPADAFICTRKENLHITLLFLGFIVEQEIPRISERLQEVAEGTSSFELVFKMITFEPELHHPTMIWLKGEPSNALRVLRDKIEQGLGYFTPEKKSFRPHVTLAKVKRKGFIALKERPLLPKSVHFVESVDFLTLFESLSDRGKRVYQPLVSYPFKGS